MSRTDRNTVIEVYALLENANESYLGLNQVLAPYRYAIVKMVLNEFESKFKVHFGIRADPNYQQIKPICRNNESMLVTDELAQVLNPEGSKGSSFSKQGYVLLLKKSFVLFEEDVKSSWERISDFTNLMDGFALSLSHSMCIAGYKNFSIASSIIHIPAFQRNVIRKKMSQPSTCFSPMVFSNRDRYFVKLYLQFEGKLKKHIKKAVALFYEAANRTDKRRKCLLLLLTMETCFNASRSNGISAQHYCRYLYALCNNYAADYESLSSNLTVLYGVRENIKLDLFNSFLIDSKMNWLENVLPEVLRNVIRLNHLPQEMLIENLERKFVALTRGQADL